MEDLGRQVLVTCEHASNRLPEGFELASELRRSHIAWDPGALPIAEALARSFKAPIWKGEYSRLLVDLNRTVGNRVMMRRVSDGHRIPFNYGLSAGDRRDRIARYYRPYRDGVARQARRIIARSGRCLHICVHTFTPALKGTVRRNDIGLLHDPRWGIERQVCEQLRQYLLAATGLVVWFNRPYSGTADGILPAMRAALSPERFVGIEIEVNQRFAGNPVALAEIAEQIATGLRRSSTLRRGLAI